MRQRPFSAVPFFAVLLLVAGLCAQLFWHFNHPLTSPKAESLPTPPSLTLLQLASFGEPIALSKILLLYLQTFDDQAGVHSSFRQLNYNQLQTWLNLTLELDPRGQYPLFLASHTYGASGDPSKRRKMFDFVYDHFFADPNRRWESLAYAAIMTRHKLNDLPAAQRYAEALYLHATDKQIPAWARQMNIFMLEDLGKRDTAIQLLRTLLQSGEVTDLNEYQFLMDRLKKLEESTQTGLPQS